MTNTRCSAKRLKNAHHEWRNYFAPGCIYNPPFRRHCRIVCIDICKLRWCSVGSVAFHWFAWPRNVKEAKGIFRTLFIDHCNWADALVVRGRCFSSKKVCFRANRVLENLLWNSSEMPRPNVVYQGGNDGISDCDLVPPWLPHECVHKGFCQCHLVGPRHQGWHHPGALYSNVISFRHQLFEKRCDCFHVQWPFLYGCNRNITNVEIAIKLFGIGMHVLAVVPPSIPQR